MHVSLDRNPIVIREGIMYYLLDEYFSYKISPSMMRIYLLQDCAVGSEVSECVKRPIHTSGCTGPQSKLHKEIGGLESRREGLREAFDCLWAAERLQREQDSLWADSFCNLDYISTYMIIQSWGFRLRLSPGYFFCVMCDWFLLISYVCSLDLAQFD